MGKGKDFKKLKNKRSKNFQVNTTIQEFDFDQFPPIFSLNHIKYLGDYCLSKCSEENKSVILYKLLRISQLTWKEIKTAHRKGLGCEQIPQHEFKAPFPCQEKK